MKLTKIVLFALVVGGSSCQDDEEQTRGTSSAQGGSRAMLVGTALKVTRDDIVSALEDYDTAANFDARMAAGMDPAIRDAIRAEASAALEAAESAAAGTQGRSPAPPHCKSMMPKRPFTKTHSAFAAVAYADDAVQATITRYAEKARTLTAAIEAAEAEIDAAAQARKACSSPRISPPLCRCRSLCYGAGGNELLQRGGKESSYSRGSQSSRCQYERD